MCEKSSTVKTENLIEVRAKVASKNDVMSMEKKPKKPNNNNPQMKANMESPYLVSRRQWGKNPKPSKH